MAYADDNIFAKIIRGEMPAVKIHEDAHVLSIMDVFPQAPGHVLVIPKEPVRNLLDLSAEALVTTMLGLITAIPLVLLYDTLANSTRYIIDVLDEQSAGLIASRSERDSAGD